MKNLKETWPQRLQYKGIILEDKKYNIWGSSPIWGNDGKVHLFSARIPMDPGFHLWWATSEIAHYVADTPEGPFEFVEVLSPTRVSQRTWERGTGETLACGSGACAVTVASILRGATERSISIELRGGELQINWLSENANVLMTGPATEVFSGQITL